MRRERGMQEPWAIIPIDVLDAPDPEAARADFANATSAPSQADRRHDAGPPLASTVTALMTGFGETVRTLGLFDGWDFDELVAHYGADRPGPD